MSILPPIRNALKELMRAQYERDRDLEEDRVFMRDVVGPTPVTAVDRKPPDPEEMARRLHKEMVAAEALLDRRDKGKPREGGAVERGRAGATAAARRRTPEVAYTGEPGAPQVQMEEESAGMPSLLPDLTRVPDSMLRGRKAPDTVQTDFTPTESKVRRRNPAVDPTPRSAAQHTEERPGSRVLLFVAIAGITALALMAVLHMSGDGEAERPQGDAGVPAAQRGGAGKAKASRASDGGGAAAEGGAGAAEGGAGAGAGEGGAGAAEGGAAEGGAAEGGAADGGAAEGGAAEGGAAEGGAAEGGAAEGGAADAAADDDAAAADDAGAAADDGSRPLVPPPPRSDNEALVIDQAISDGKIRSLDALLVLKVTTDAMTWDEAADHCRVRAVAGIRGWHLPSTTEIKRLRRSRMLGTLTYWTRSRNADRDEAFALDNRSGRLNLYLTVERVARPICVRTR
jgi:hypothetical protein